METENAIPSTEQSDWNSFQIFPSHFTHHFHPFRVGITTRKVGCLRPWHWVSTSPPPSVCRRDSRPANRPWRPDTPALTQRLHNIANNSLKSLKSVRFKSLFSHHSYTLGTTKLLNRFAFQPTHKTSLAERMEGNSSHELIWIWYLFQFFTIKISAIWERPDFLCCLLWVGFCADFLRKLSITLCSYLPSAFLQHDSAWDSKLGPLCR